MKKEIKVLIKEREQLKEDRKYFKRQIDFAKNQREIKVIELFLRSLREDIARITRLIKIVRQS